MCKNVVADKAYINDIKALIQDRRKTVAYAVNSEMSLLYWNGGKLINEEILQHNRAEDVKQILDTLSKNLIKEYGTGWSKKQFLHCIRFSEIFPDQKIFSTLWRQLTWSQIKFLLYMDDPLKRDLYIELFKHEKWSIRQLQECIKSMLFERTATMLGLLIALNEVYLIIDQTEYDLDTKLISNVIVETFKKLKKRKQLIILYHNPNIVENANSDNIIYLDFHEGQIKVKENDMLQNINIRKAVCEVMQGGREALKKRYFRISESLK